jgi:hypothetical protein
MLTTAVRAAAAQFATSQLGTSSVAAIEKGYRAPRTARFPLAGDQAFKRLLGQYLGERIDVYHPGSNRYGLLRGLPACYENDGEPFADVEFYVDAEGREEGGGDVLYDAHRILPVLYSFEDLATEIQLADGRRVVPAVEVARLYCAVDEADRLCYREQWDTLKVSVAPDTYTVTWEVEEWAQFDPFGEWDQSDSFWGKLVIHRDGTAAEETQEGWISIPPAYLAKLREWHFAVDLAPHQYHRKQVAVASPKPFEYLTFGEPLPTVTPCPSGRNDCPSGCAKCPAEMEVARA